MENESDERLIERFQSGERAAFEEIARRYRPRLLRFLRVRTRSLESAEDLTQETLMKAFASLGSLRRGEFFAGWLHRVAFRTLVDSTRRRRLDVASLDENQTVDGVNGEAAQGVFALRTPPRRPNGSEFDAVSPEDRVVRADEGENIWRVAREILTPKEFKTLWMRYVDEATDAEIALALGATRGAVRVSLTRARQKLIARLQTENNENERKNGKRGK